MASLVTVTTDTDSNPLLRDPDVRLMLRAKEGNVTAFNQLVLRYQDRLVGVLFQLVQDHQQAENLAQEVFLRVYRARHGYEPTAKFSTWLFRIANNLASNARRDQGRRKEVHVAEQRSPSGAQVARPLEQMAADRSGMMPQRMAAKSEMQRIVHEAVQSLDHNQRVAVVLNKYEEMSYADIAATLEMSQAAVKSLLSRARDNLRVKLEPYFKSGALGALSGEPAEDEEADASDT